MPNHNPHTAKQRIMRWVLAVGIALTLLKLVAYYITKSNAILSDAIESFVNIAAGFFALFSVWFAAQSSDENHPYGHGKIEYIATAFEGGMILIAGLAILYKGIMSFFFAMPLQEIDLGLILSIFAGLINFGMGKYLVLTGKKYHSMTLEADGKHLLSDAYSSVGLVFGLVAIRLTGLYWIDSMMAVVFGILIIYTAWGLLRNAMKGLLDEYNPEMITLIAQKLEEKRENAWIDIHKLRVLSYGYKVHVTFHVTMPWYESLEVSHRHLKKIEKIIQENIEKEVEFSTHADPCEVYSCHLCAISTCPYRKHPFERVVEWKLENIQENKRHHLKA